MTTHVGLPSWRCAAPRARSRTRPTLAMGQRCGRFEARAGRPKARFWAGVRGNVWGNENLLRFITSPSAIREAVEAAGAVTERSGGSTRGPRSPPTGATNARHGRWRGLQALPPNAPSLRAAARTVVSRTRLSSSVVPAPSSPESRPGGPLRQARTGTVARPHVGHSSTTHNLEASEHRRVWDRTSPAIDSARGDRNWSAPSLGRPCWLANPCWPQWCRAREGLGRRPAQPRWRLFSARPSTALDTRRRWSTPTLETQ